MDMLIELNMYEALTEAGVQPGAARQVERQMQSAFNRQHEALRSEMREQLMTKADGQELRSELKSDMLMLRNDMHELRAELKNDMHELRNDMHELRAEFKSDMYELRAELKGDMHELGLSVQRGLTEQTWKLASLVIVANGIMLAALKFIL